jgi:cytochrome b6-f complex iron-sulfur subunit
MQKAIARTPLSSQSWDRPEIKVISRREFLYYLWGASAGIAAIGACGASAWFAIPHPRINQPNGIFILQRENFPELNSPIGNLTGGFWLIYTEKGLSVLNMLCPHRGDALYKWVDTRNRFECPACGSKFIPDGTCIDGPAPRGLDTFILYITTVDGERKTISNSGPIDMENVAEIQVDTRFRVKGSPRLYE